MAGQQKDRSLHKALLAHKIVGEHSALAEDMAAAGTLMEVKAATILIEQDAQDDDMYLIVSGSFNVLVNGRQVSVCGAGDHVGEISPMRTIRRRTATVVAAEDSTVLRLSESQMSQLGEKYPQIWRHLAKEMIRRLEHHNAKVTKARERSRILVLAPAAGMAVAHAVEKSLSADNATVTVWSEGVFRSARYSIDALEAELAESDFAVIVVPPHESDGGRENVIFELGFFIGRLGRNRTLLLEPATDPAKLPSDLNGLVTIGYRLIGHHAPDVAHAAARIRAIVAEFGPR